MTPVDELEQADPEGLVGRIQGALQWAASLGLVEVWEAGVRDWRFLDALLHLRSLNVLPVRVRLLIAAGLAETGMRQATGDPWCEIAGIKFYADGWLGSRTCAISGSFHDEPDNGGILFETVSSLVQRITPFADRGYQIATHAIGDRAIATTLDAYEKIYGGDCRNSAPRIEHAQVLRDDLIQRMSEMGVVACIQPGFGVMDAPQAALAIDDDFPFAYRWDRLLGSGVNVITGSDYPIDDLSPLEGLKRLIMNPFYQMPAADAFHLMTDATKGEVNLSRNPLQSDPEDLAAIEVLGTFPSDR